MQGLYRGRAGVFACALGLIVWSCSSDSRDFGDAQQPGGAGDPGEPASAGAGGLQANAGAAGDSTGGPVAGAGGKSQSEGLSVVSTSPTDAETGTERNAAIEVSFSAAIDEASIAAQSFKVTGPTGVVDGELSVDGATVTFTPSAPWALLADYVVDVAKTVAGTEAGALGAAYRFGFQSRDGIFGKPVRLTSESVYLSRPVANRAGDVVVGWSAQVGVAHSTVLFDSRAGKWGMVQPLDSSSASDPISYAVRENGEAIVFVGPSSGTTNWIRWNGSIWSAPKAKGGLGTRHAVFGTAGTAVAMWETFTGGELDCTVSVAEISSMDTWGPTTPLDSKVRAKALGRFGPGYLAIYANQADHEIFSRRFEAGAWAAEQPVSAVAPAHYAFDTEGATALFTWIDPASQQRASLYDGVSWTPANLGQADWGVWADLANQWALATWFYKSVAYGAVYAPGSGWLDPSRLGAGVNDFAGDVGPPGQIDDSGNALVAWRDGSNIVWRRAPHAQDWLEPQLIRDQEPYYVYSTNDAAGIVTLVWSNALGVWASRFE
jgi:Bacterial Ig-like domain